MSPLLRTVLPVLALVAGAALTPAAAAGPQAPDTAGPVISVTAPAGHWQGWYDRSVEVWARAVDGDGIERLGYSMRGAHTGTGWFDGESGRLVIENPGSTQITFIAYDGEGNQSRIAHTVGVDLTAPAIELSGTLTDGATVTRNEARTLVFACHDPETDVARCESTPHHESGQNVDTSALGVKQISFYTTNNVGRWTQRTLTYTVVNPHLAVTAGPYITGHDGTPRFGDTLRAAGAEFSPAAESVTFQWLRDGEVVAMGIEYAVTRDDIGHEIGLSATGRRSGYEDTPAGLNVIGPVERAEFALSGPGRLDGAPVVGQVLRVAAPSVAPAPATATYHWTIGEGAQASETVTDQPSLALTAAHLGRMVSVRVRYESPTHASWAPVTLDGEPGGPTWTAPVTAAAPPAADSTKVTVLAAASIQGKAKVGKRLRAVLPGLSGPVAAWRYQWLRNGTPIKGATGRAYTVRKADLRRRISVRVTASAPNVPDVVSVAKAKRVRR